MTDPVLQAAFDREAELMQELEKIQNFIKTYRVLALTITPGSANAAGTEQDQSAPSPNPVDGAVSGPERKAQEADEAPPKRIRVRDNPKPEDVVLAAVDVIRAAGRPLSRRQIYDALKERGMEVRGVDAVKTLGTMLWRSGQGMLQQIEGYGYWPTGDTVPPQYNLNFTEEERALFG